MNKQQRFSSLVIAILFLCSIASCSSEKKLVYTKNTNKSDTIYIYYKGSDKNELRQKHVIDNTRNYYRTQYKFIFDYDVYYPGGKKFYNFGFSSHNTGGGQFTRIAILQKNKSFLKKQKNKIFTYKDLKKQSEIEINKFYTYNRFKTVFLIDKRDNKKDKIYLRKVYFTGSYRVLQ